MPELDYDVVFYDTVSMVYTEDTPNHKGLGGSEILIINLAQELASQGFSVLVLNDPMSHESTEPSPENPIVAKSGVHYASYRCRRPTISCGALLAQRTTPVPNDPRYEPGENGIKRDRTLVWIHDAIFNENDPSARATAKAIAKPINKGGAVPIFTSEWSRSIYPPDAVGRYSRMIPNFLPRLVFDDKWKATPQEDVMLFASSAIRGLDPTLKAWADPRVVASGKTVLEILGPAYDPPPDSESGLHFYDDALTGRIKLAGTLALPQLLQRMAASRGQIYACQFEETFCLTVAYMEALGNPVRFMALRPSCFAGVPETLQHKQFIYGPLDWDRFVGDLADELSSGQRTTVEPVRKFHPDKILPMWFDVLGLEA